MKKNILDDLYICNLYQVDKEVGYLSKNELKKGIICNEHVNKIGTVIVKKSNLSKYRLKEILTNVPIDTLYTIYDEFNEQYKFCGNSREYNTFIYLDIYDESKYNKKYYKVTEDDFDYYFDKHSDVKEYRNELLELLKQGKSNHDKMKHQNYLKKQEEDRAESEENNRIYSKIMGKTYKRVRKINNK
ncbi:MAG: hypothetical protein VZS44_06695 [Bacilli bacterium]|nr:hypothetical protein [Bacilli bacterium]